MLCASETKLKTLVNNIEKGEGGVRWAGGPDFNEQFLLSTRMCFSRKTHFLLTVSEQFCN